MISSSASLSQPSSKSKTESLFEEALFHDLPLHFSLEDPISQSSETLVFLARDNRKTYQGRKVVIKAVRPDTAIGFKRILREVQILKELSCRSDCQRYVPRLLEVEVVDKGDACLVFIIFEYLGSVSLKQYLDESKQRRLSANQAKILTHNLVRAVDSLHQAGVLHRDLKPDNIIVDPNSLSVKVIDFGLARTINKIPEVDGVIQQSLASSQEAAIAAGLRESASKRKRERRSLSPHVYTRAYRPPEVCLLQKQYSFAADIWSLGCVIAEVIQSQEQYSIEGDDPEARKMFRATSCHPLSPRPSGDSETLSTGDLIEAILETLGDQSDDDLSFITGDATQAYVKQHFAKASPVDFQQELEGTSPQLCQVLQQTLRFNPYFRATASSLVAIFEDRQPKLSDPKPTLTLEVDAADSFDYDRQKSKYSKDQLKHLLLLEGLPDEV